jgi:hypothetical protein
MRRRTFTYETVASVRTFAELSEVDVLLAVPQCVAWTPPECRGYPPSWRRSRVVS